MTRKSRREIERRLEGIASRRQREAKSAGLDAVVTVGTSEGYIDPETGERYAEPPEADAVADFSETQT